MIDLIDYVGPVTSDDWCTPIELANDLGLFGVDPCSNPRSHVRADRKLSLEDGDDGLTEPWNGSVFLNPPYSQPLPWCRRLALHDGPWVALVKLDTTTRWWAALMSASPQWAPFRARVRFEAPGKSATANFASALVWSCWRPSRAMASRLWIPTYEAQG